MKKFSLFILILFLAVSFLTAGEGKILKKYTLNIEKPTGLSFDGTNFWITDRLSAKIYKVSKQGKILKSFQAPGPWPIGIAYCKGKLWVADRADKKAYLISLDGKTIYKSIAIPAKTPSGITAVRDGLWVATERDKKIIKISKTDGSIIKEFPAPKYLNGIHIYDKNGNFFASSRINDRIYRGSIKYGIFYFYFPVEFSYSWGVFYDGKNLWNIDQAGRTLNKLYYSEKDNWIKGEAKKRIIRYRSGIYNYGPGKVKELKIYVALPENKYNQKIESIKYYFKGKTIKPKRIIKDKTGQRYAYFFIDNVKAGERVRVITEFRFIHQQVQAVLTPEKVKGDIPENIKKIYLGNGERFDYNNPYIEKKVRELLKGCENYYMKVHKLYKFVGDTVTYKLYGGWEPAPIVLKRGSGSCSEYSFSFLALLRKAGIPARYVGTISRRGDDIGFDDVFHRWVEVYFPGFGWAPVDPDAGDSKVVDDQIFFYGGTKRRYLITTRHVGPSPYLKWEYNSVMYWKTEGRAKVYEDRVAEWYLPNKQ
jgi:hypothetical protein